MESQTGLSTKNVLEACRKVPDAYQHRLRKNCGRIQGGKQGNGEVTNMIFLLEIGSSCF